MWRSAKEEVRRKKSVCVARSVKEDTLALAYIHYFHFYWNHYILSHSYFPHTEVIFATRHECVCIHHWLWNHFCVGEVRVRNNVVISVEVMNVYKCKCKCLPSHFFLLTFSFALLHTSYFILQYNFRALSSFLHFSHLDTFITANEIATFFRTLTSPTQK